MSKLRVVIVEVGEAPRVAEIDDGLESMQKIVGGYVEAIALDDDLVIWANEEGTFSEPFNRAVPVRAPAIPPGWESATVIEVRDPDDPPFARPGQMGVHRIHGDFFFARSDDGGETLSLRDSDLSFIAGLLGCAIVGAG